MELPDHLKFSMECELNPALRKADRLRALMLQLQALRNELPADVMLERQRDLLRQYRHEVDRSDGGGEGQGEGANTWLDMVERLTSHHKREIKPQTWRSSLTEQIKSGQVTAAQLVSELNPQLVPFIEVSKCWKEYNQKKTAFVKSTLDKFRKHEKMMKTDQRGSVKEEKVDDDFEKDIDFVQSPTDKRRPETPPQPAPVASVRSKFVPPLRNSPTRVSGLFKSAGSKSGGNSSHTKSLFSRNGSSDSNSSGSRDELPAADHGARSPPKEPEVRKNAFVTGLEKHLTDQVLNNKMSATQARQEMQNFRQQAEANNRQNKKKDNNKNGNATDDPLLLDERLKGIEPAMIEMIRGEIVTDLTDVDWKQIAGLDFVKSKIQEIAIMPLLRPDLFTGLRSPPKGILLFGPPGTGKTMIGRCIASQARATFFSITSSTLTSKWIGDGEKAMRTMFEVARCLRPSVIFIDEIDSLLKARSDGEHESSRRMKTEFLSQFDGLSSRINDGLLVIGTTNRPADLDEAVRRRFAAKLYIPFPEQAARRQMLINNLENEKNSLKAEEYDEIAEKTDGYSGSDMHQLCTEAAFYSFKEVRDRLSNIGIDDIRPINVDDFRACLNRVKPSVAAEVVGEFETWNTKFGCDC